MVLDAYVVQPSKMVWYVLLEANHIIVSCFPNVWWCIIFPCSIMIGYYWALRIWYDIGFICLSVDPRYQNALCQKIKTLKVYKNLAFIGGHSRWGYATSGIKNFIKVNIIL